MLIFSIILALVGLVIYTFAMRLFDGIESDANLAVIFTFLGVVILLGAFVLFYNSVNINAKTEVKTRTLNLIAETKEVEIHTYNDGTIYYTLADSTYKKLFNYLITEEK